MRKLSCIIGFIGILILFGVLFNASSSDSRNKQPPITKDTIVLVSDDFGKCIYKFPHQSEIPCIREKQNYKEYTITRDSLIFYTTPNTKIRLTIKFK
jgi:hypothetical protein